MTRSATRDFAPLTWLGALGARSISAASQLATASLSTLPLAFLGSFNVA